MNIIKLAFRYAKALFESDFKNNQHEKRLEEFEYMLSLLKTYPKLNKILLSPSIDLAGKLQVIRSLFDHEPDPIFLKFMELLLEKKRFRYFNQITFDYRLIIEHSLNIWEVSFVTAIPLEKEFEEKIRLRLEKYYRKKIKMKNEIDPTIIGAAIIILNNKMIDWSVAGRLKAIKEKLLETGSCGGV